MTGMQHVIVAQLRVICTYVVAATVTVASVVIYYIYTGCCILYMYTSQLQYGDHASGLQ